jgi:hypothetical protein
MKTVSMAVPETTPSWPVLATARASGQPEMATPIPPWMSQGSGARLGGVIALTLLTGLSSRQRREQAADNQIYRALFQ